MSPLWLALAAAWAAEPTATTTISATRLVAWEAAPAGEGPTGQRVIELERRRAVVETRGSEPALLDRPLVLPDATHAPGFEAVLEGWRVALERAGGAPVVLLGAPPSPYGCSVGGRGEARTLLAKILDCHDGNLVWHASWRDAFPGDGVWEITLEEVWGPIDPLAGTRRPTYGDPAAVGRMFWWVMHRVATGHREAWEAEPGAVTWRRTRIGHRMVTIATRADGEALLDREITLIAPPGGDLFELGVAWTRAVQAATGTAVTPPFLDGNSPGCALPEQGPARALLAALLDCANGNLVWALGAGQPDRPERSLALDVPPGLPDPLEGTRPRSSAW